MLKNKDVGANNHYFIRGYYFYFFIFFTCYHYVNFYFGLITKGVALLIIPNYLLFHTLEYLKDVNVIFDTLDITLKSIYNFYPPCF